jgi:hypothetical protein
MIEYTFHYYTIYKFTFASDNKNINIKT